MKRSSREFKDAQAYADGLVLLKDLKDRRIKASQTKASGTGLSALYNTINREISELESMCTRFRAKNPTVGI